MWLDRDSINPGESWERAIYSAIEKGNFFLACFSNEYYKRDTTFMDDELKLAIEQLNIRSTKKKWFIPVRLSNCEISPKKIKTDELEVLRGIQWVDLFEDWEAGIKRILRVIRPQRIIKDAMELRRQLIEAGCKKHIKSKVEYFTKQGAFRVKDIENRWQELFKAPNWDTFLDITSNLFDRAESSNKPLTERFIEPDQHGRVILISAAPMFDTSEFLETLPLSQTTTKENRYVHFILDQRKRMRQLPEWQKRDLVHWIFRQESPDSEMEIDLLYICNFELYLHILMYQLDKKMKPMPLEQIYPTTLMTVPEIDELMQLILQEEAGLSM